MIFMVKHVVLGFGFWVASRYRTFRVKGLRQRIWDESSGSRGP